MAKRLTKKEIEAKKEDAYIFYMAGMTYIEIMDRTGIKSNKTIGDWVKLGGWDAKRGAQTVTRPELINKILMKISEKLDDDSYSPDQYSKMAATIERLDKQNNPVIIMGILTQFDKFLAKGAQTDSDIDLELIKKVNRYHMKFIDSIMAGNDE